MDEAFLPFSGLVARLLPIRGELADELAGVRASITVCEIDTPVELEITADASGALRIGTVPPLYRVATSLRPSYHRLRLTVRLAENGDGS